MMYKLLHKKQENILLLAGKENDRFIKINNQNKKRWEHKVKSSKENNRYVYIGKKIIIIVTSPKYRKHNLNIFRSSFLN